MSKLKPEQTALSRECGGGTLKQELKRTAEMMVEINDRKDMGGIYMALCLLFDTQRPLDKEFLEILKNTPGAIKELPRGDPDGK